MAGAARNSPFTILLLGRTGMGKSTTGNKLIDAVTDDNPTGNEMIKQRWPRVAEGKLNFATIHQAVDSVTEHCSLLISKTAGGEVQVLDSVGFADSKGPNGVQLGNLKVMREIAGVSDELDIVYDRVLYLLPVRGRPEKADGTLQEEMEVMWHFFGEGIFKNMVLVSTLQSGIPGHYKPSDTDVEWVFSVAMGNVLGRLGIKMSKPPRPPVLFISWESEPSTLLTAVKDVKVNGGKTFSPKFRNEVCTKCATELLWRDGTIVEVKYEGKLCKPNATKCHPFFIPKYSKLKKFFGGVAHVIVLGTAKLHELRTKNPTWPGWFNKDEACANPKCKKAPGSKGCQWVSVVCENKVVQHCNNLKAEGVVLSQ